MKRLMKNTIGLMFAGILAGNAFAGEASTTASAANGWGRNSGTAAATANYDGDGGRAIARTRTTTGNVNVARGLAVGMDEDGMDLSFSHAFASRFGPAYAGTFNLSIGHDGKIAASYGGALAQGGLVRSVEAGGVTRSGPGGPTAQANAGGRADPNGTVQARTNSYTHRPIVQPIVRPTAYPRLWRR
jgi:hypothetical protein